MIPERQQYNVIYLLGAWLVFITFYRCSLVGKGALSTPDEALYSCSIQAVERLGKGDVPGFLESISDEMLQSRPGCALIFMLPAAGEGVLYKLFGAYPSNPIALLVPTFFNVFISTLVTFFFFKVSLLLTGNNKIMSLFGTVLYSLCANTNLYIRHVFPYTAAVLFFLLNTCYLLSCLQRSKDKKLTVSQCFFSGMLTAFGFTVYPGYYIVPLLILSLLVFVDEDKLLSKSKVIKCTVFGCSAFGYLALMQLLSTLGNNSYLDNANRASGLITHGSFEEGYSFLFKYLFEVEGIIGLFYSVGALCFVGYGVYLFLKGDLDQYSRPAIVLFLVASFGFLFHATAAFFFKRIVFHGRSLHIYYPVIIWAMIFLVDRMPSHRWKFTVIAILTLISLSSFVRFAVAYARVDYPRDVLYQYGVETAKLKEGHWVDENQGSLKYGSPRPWNNSDTKYDQRPGDYVVVNASYFWPDNYTRFNIPMKATVLYEGPHFLEFKAYQFEGFTIERRFRMDKRNYNLTILKLAN